MAISETSHYVTMEDSLKIYVRHKYPADSVLRERRPPVLFVHGATYSSQSAFDTKLPGGSWMDLIAERGFDVYAVDLRGYGLSQGYYTGDKIGRHEGKYCDTAQALKDVRSVIQFIFEDRMADSITLVGWSWGTSISALYASMYPDHVHKLVLYAPLWFFKDEHRILEAPRDDFRSVTGEQAYKRAIQGIDPDMVEAIRPRESFDHWWNQVLTLNHAGNLQSDCIHVPNGVINDLVNEWGNGNALYDPSAIRSPTLLLVGELDIETPPYMTLELFGALVNARRKQLMIFGNATHNMILETGRKRLMDEVQFFLEDGLGTAQLFVGREDQDQSNYY